MSSDPGNRRDVAALATRAALLDAAREAFGSRGYAAVSLVEIARAARATTGALYHHFADKRALFVAVAEGVEAEIVANLTQGVPQTTDLWELVRYAVAGTLDEAARPGVARIIFKDAATVIGAAEWREIEMRYGFGTLNALLQALAATGRLRGHDPAIVASLLLGALVQAVESVAISEHPARTLDAARRAMLDLLAAFGGTAAPDR